jgi:nucleoside-diphosphate-sugar epimerase
MKRVLLIAGGGTLGTYTAEELLRMGCAVDVICPEEKKSDHPNLRFIRSLATEELLRELFAAGKYDGIVNFIHYKTLDAYRQIHPLLIANTEHLIFLSSYRVYADRVHPITEDAPRLYDVSEDAEFLQNEDYAVPKSRCEDYLRRERAGEPWTIVRPVISFSQYRLDLYVHSGKHILEYAERGEPLRIPSSSRYLTAGIDWAGNSGKLIARLLFKPHTWGETYTVSSAQNLTWDQVAAIYHELIGLEVDWCSDESFYEQHPRYLGDRKWILDCDRRFDRTINNEKILAATGLCSTDFMSIRDGIAMELNQLRRNEKA